MTTHVTKTTLVIILLLILPFSFLWADDVKQDDILKSAACWIAQNTVFMEGNTEAIPSKATQLTASDGTALPLWLVDLSPTGYIIMGADDTLPPVVAFNANTPYSNTTPPLPDMLSRQGKIFQAALNTPQTRGNNISTVNQSRWQALLQPTRADSITPAVIIRQPMLSTTWNQDYPYNLLAPRSPDGNPAWAGCVPVAMAQLLKYHEWPPAGTEIVSSTDTDGDVTASLQADLSVPYEWELMLDNYDGKETALEALPLARLLLEAGILLKANYGLEGTSAKSSRIQSLLIQHLRYSSTSSDDNTPLYERIYQEMFEGHPAIVSYGGHAFVADGLGLSLGLDYYHFNYGWGGHANGWYLLTDGYNSTVIIGATTNIQPAPIPVFRPMSVEQPSSFTLSWDFPKRLTAEAFRLTITPEDNDDMPISTTIYGKERSCTVTNQYGTNTYTLQAMVNGIWQDASEGITITVKNNPIPMPTLTLQSELSCLAGGLATTTISSNNTLANVSVISSRPDILPDSDIVVSGSGKSRTVKLLPASASQGNLLLYVTARDLAGNTVRKTILLHVLKNNSVTRWHTSLAQAASEALQNRKLILLVTGDNGNATSNFRNTICETGEIKAELLENYTLWYCNSSSSEYRVFTQGLGSSFPLNAIIDPDNLSRRLRGHGGPMTVEETRRFLDKNAVYFNLDSALTYERGRSYPLEVSHLDRNAVIHYRLDTLAPTGADPAVMDVIMLTDTVTITARAFKNGLPISNEISKTYSFAGWHTSLANAVAEARKNRKLILLVAGNEDEATDYFKNSICESNNIKSLLQEDYILWQCNYYSSSEHYVFTHGLGSTFPLNVIISPDDLSRRLRGHEGPMTVAETSRFLDKHSLFFNLPPSKTFERGNSYPLELSYLDRNVVIHYRLDTTTPTISDPVADDLIMLTDTTTVTARAFKNGSPITEAISQTYSFTGWNTTLANAIEEARNNHKLILLVTGNEDNATNYFKNTICKADEVKEQLLENYTLWYCNYYASDEHGVFTQGLGDSFPLNAIIDPDDLTRRLRGHGGPMTLAETRLFLDKHSVYFNLDPSMTLERGNSYPLELSFLDRNVTIHYRLDATTPTVADPIADGVITLTDTATIAARAFKNGSPITDELIKIYTFTGRIPPPLLDKLPIDFFVGNCTLKATCITNGAIIRYTTDPNDFPTETSPVFPEAGLSFTDHAFVRVCAFKEGILQSEYVTCELIPAFAFDDARAIAPASEIVFFTTGNAWFLQTDTFQSAPSAMQSAKIKDNKSTALIAKVIGEGSISFAWKASSEEAFDKLAFYVDGELQGSISGNSVWKHMDIDVIGDGEHLLNWIFSKDFSGSEYNDCAWVDDIVWTKGRKTDMTFILSPGWNLVGIPFKLDDTSTRILAQIPSIGYDIVSRSYQRTRQNYAPGSAVWVFADTEASLTLKGIIQAPQAQSLHKGWNLFTPVQPPNASQTSEIPHAPIWIWSATGYRLLPEGQKLLPGTAYWLFLETE